MSRLLAPLCLALATACATTQGAGTSEKPVGSTRASDYYPLEVGNRWGYQVSLLGERRALEVSIVSREGVTATDSTGAHFTTDAFGVRDEKRYLLREPIAVDTQWTNVVSVSSVERYKIVEVGRRCESPAGQFDECVVVESHNRVSEGRELVARFTFARGVGMVRVETTLHQGDKQVPQSTLELAAYGVKGVLGARSGGALPPPSGGVGAGAPPPSR